MVEGCGIPGHERMPVVVGSLLFSCEGLCGVVGCGLLSGVCGSGWLF